MIVCAALKHSSGLIVCGVRHFDTLMVNQIKVSTVQSWANAEQGFVDHKGQFWNRIDAKMLARESNQIVKQCGGDSIELFSENLY